MTDDLIVYGTNWCGDCHRTRRFLDQHNVPYRYVDVDADRTAAALITKINYGNRKVPTLVFADGSIMVEPSTRQLSEKLGITA